MNVCVSWVASWESSALYSEDVGSARDTPNPEWSGNCHPLIVLPPEIHHAHTRGAGGWGGFGHGWWVLALPYPRPDESHFFLHWTHIYKDLAMRCAACAMGTTPRPWRRTLQWPRTVPRRTPRPMSSNVSRPFPPPRILHRGSPPPLVHCALLLRLSKMPSPI